MKKIILCLSAFSILSFAEDASTCKEIKNAAIEWSQKVGPMMKSDKNGDDFSCAAYEGALATSSINAGFYDECPSQCQTFDCDRWKNSIPEIKEKIKEKGCDQKYLKKYMSHWSLSAN
jgi:hypothetical protein